MGDRARVVLCVRVCTIGTAIALGAYAAHVLRSVELKSVDKRFSIRGANHPKDVVLVAIDAATFSGFDNQLQWPFPRLYHARVIDRVAAGHPKAIAVDLQFTEQTDTIDDDALIEAVAKAHDVVLATTEVDAQGNTNVFGGPSVLRSIGAHAANSLFATDSDGVMRQLAESVNGLTTIGVATAAVAEGRPVPPAGRGSHWIDFAGPPGTMKTYSYSDVYFGKVRASAFRDKVVVIGVSAPWLKDLHPTSTGVLPAPEVQGNAIETALHNYPLRSVPGWLNVLLIILLGMIPLIAIRLGLGSTFGIAVAAGLVFAVAAQVAFNAGHVVVFVYPLLALALSMLGVLLISANRADRWRG